MPNQIPASHLKVYAEHVKTLGKVTLSEENILTVLRMAEDEISFRAVLKQIATSGASNRELVAMAANALRERPARQVAAANQLVTLEAVGG